jgi:transcriptional antiterminator RfaH
VETLLWYVAHAKPRCEKKLVRHCERERLAATLPCYRTRHKYRGKIAEFLKPLFPGYVFLRIAPEQTRLAQMSNCIANLLTVPDQPQFEQQLRDIERALETDLEVRLAPEIGVGMRVQIKAGPLRGLEGWVEQRHGPDVVLLRLEFIGQAAAVKVGALDLEPS